MKKTSNTKKVEVHIPENLQKKLARNSRITKAKKKKEERKRLLTENRKKRMEYVRRAKIYALEYKNEEEALLKKTREAKMKGDFFVPAENQVIFVVRIRGIIALRPQVQKILQLLRLRQIYNGVFLKVNKASINMLRKVEPYVTYGYPTKKTISDLIYKRGYAKVDRRRIPLSDNKIIESQLGKFNIICVEDLIHEIVTCGPHFKEANNFLWPFKLSSPRHGFKAKRHSFICKGDWGNREEYINELVKRMN